MRIPRIFTEQDLQANTGVSLEPGPSQHIGRALRMSIGEYIHLFNGRGGIYPAVIASIDKKSVKVTTEDWLDQESESPLAVELGIAISRGDRMDWIIQKATELGVTHIAPLQTERTEVKLKGDRADKKQQHWRQIAVSACEQCGRNRLPQITDLQTLDGWLATTKAERKFVLHHRDTGAAAQATQPASVALLVGPEGGLSSPEIERAATMGFEALTLGPRVLRTETAPLAAVAILQAQWGDMPLEL